MSRSVWKNIYVDQDLLDSLNKSSDLVQTNSRESTIIQEFNKRTISVYNGKQYFIIKVSPSMLGYKLGEFVYTKKICVYKKIKKLTKKYSKKK